MSEMLSTMTAVRRASHTKIVATVGPACESPAMLAHLIRAGVDVFRINTAHGTRDDHARLLGAVRSAEEETGHPVGVLVDLAGPKMRLGELAGGAITCQSGEELRFVRGDRTQRPTELVCTYETLIDELQPGDRIMLADGTVALQVERVETDAATCRVEQGGTLRSRQGVNLPGVRLQARALSERDRDAARWAAGAGADFIGLSFVRTPEEVHELRTLLKQEASDPEIVAKIEKPEALENLEEIVAAADAVMVARGDLGVEIDIARIAVVQKEIVAACRRAQRPVIIATQMLDSMHHSRLPTRAEATDVANAILDGADACMLSGETAIGEFPREAVEMMHRIAMATEPLLRQFQRRVEPATSTVGPASITNATAQGAAAMAERLRARLIVVASATGLSALSVSQTRTFVPTVGVSASLATLRRMALCWGVLPLQGAPALDDSALLEFVLSRGRSSGDLVPGDRIVLITGTTASNSGHNTVIVHEVD